FIKRLRPIVYNFDTRKFDDFLMQDMPDSLRDLIISKNDYSRSSDIRQSGFIAQEVEVAASESGYVFNGIHKPVDDKDNYSIAYSLFTVPLVKAVQELDEEDKMMQLVIDQQQKAIENQQKTIDELQDRISVLENLLLNK
ncbi:MAG: hypothetical protein ABIJ16_10110, partial [Bacteroidota bacterium]